MTPAYTMSFNVNANNDTKRQLMLQVQDQMINQMGIQDLVLDISGNKHTFTWTHFDAETTTDGAVYEVKLDLYQQFMVEVENISDDILNDLNWTIDHLENIDVKDFLPNLSAEAI